MHEFTQAILAVGVPRDTVIYLIGLPVLATLIAFARQIIGIKGFGIYTSLLLALSLVALGVKYGLATFAAILVIGTFARFLIKKLRLTYLPRMALLLTFVSLALLGLFYTAGYLSRAGIFATSILAVLIMLSLVEKFISAQIEKGGKAAVILILETLVLALASYYLVTWHYLQKIILEFPLLVITGSIVFNVLLGKWTGLRLFEHWRFREILKKI